MGTKYVTIRAMAGLSAVFCAPQALAGEVYGGVYAHGVETPFTLEAGENGADIQIGYRLDPIEELVDIEPYITGSVNTDGGTNFAAIGLSRKFDLNALYIRPGIGLVIHDGPSFVVDPDTGRRIDLGSRILFEPELAIGAHLSEKVSVEASWVHISNAQLFNSRQNPGIDMIGVRLNLDI